MNKTVLVVDDSSTTRMLIRNCLARIGLQVVEADNGATGLARARAQQVDLIIADVNMPMMTGIEMITELRKSSDYAKVPIFVITTESGARVAEGREAGATAWIVKPFKPETLQAAVKKVLAI